MIEREIAWRVFAHEFNHSDYFFHEGDERSPNYLVTPTGAKINRLYFVGVLTEIDNIGVGEDMWRGRVSDPTGAFTVYAGQYQPEAAVFLSGLGIPSFVAVVGKARVYEPGEGTMYTSVRPEELNTADGSIRDRWIVDTARLTFERIQLVRAALDAGLQGEDLIDMLVRSGASIELADGIKRAIEHYTDLDRYLKTLSTIIIDALKTLLPADYPATMKTDALIIKGTPAQQDEFSTAIVEDNKVAPTRVVEANAWGSQVKEIPSGYSLEEKKPAMVEDPEAEYTSGDLPEIDTPEPEENQPDAEEIVYELMCRLDTGKGIHVAELMEESKRSGLSEDQVDEAVKILMSEGKCYEPRIGVLRKV